MARHLIVVDTETTGLDPAIHLPLEVAAINAATGETLRFVPYIPDLRIQIGWRDQPDADNAHAIGDPGALRVNRYYERGLYREMASANETVGRYRDLWKMLAGNTLGGCNPSFDARMLVAGYRHAVAICTTAGTKLECEPVWHHRLADLSAYAAPILGLPPTELPGLQQICDLLGVTNRDPHTALGDAQATDDCFHKIAIRAVVEGSA